MDEAYRCRSDGRTECCLSIGHIGEDGNELAVDDVVGAASRTERAAGGGLTLAIAGPKPVNSKRQEKVWFFQVCKMDELRPLTLHINRGPHVLHHISWRTRSRKVSILRKSVNYVFPLRAR
jgi:hypothetical protein